MGRGTKTTEFLKECMADSILKLLPEKSIDKITVKEITNHAGVSRSTWFRNFSSKNEALTFKLIQLWEHWADEHYLAEHHRYSYDNIDAFFHFNYEIRHILTIIDSAGLQTVVYDAFYQVMMPQYGANAEECYHSRFYSYGLFGLLAEWVKRGFCETPEEMAELFKKIG